MRRMRRRVHVLLVAVGIAMLTPPGVPAVSAQADPSGKSSASKATLEAEVERLKADVEDLRHELRLIRELLVQRLGQPQRAAPRPVKVAVGDNPVLGRADAPVTLVEFSDYQCPFCRQFFDATFPALKKEYIETGKVRYAFRDFPIDEIHPLARKAAEAARCAGDQGKYWEMHDLLFANQPALQRDELVTYARRSRLDVGTFTACLESGKHTPAVERSLADGMSAGVRGTPAFVLGRSSADNTVESVLITGARPVEAFRGEIERLLSGK